MDIVCGHCEKASPMKQWKLIHHAPFHVGNLGIWQGRMLHEQGDYDRLFSSCSLVCPLCGTQQTVTVLSLENKELLTTVDKAGLAYAALFAPAKEE